MAVSISLKSFEAKSFSKPRTHPLLSSEQFGRQNQVPVALFLSFKVVWLRC
jgi:hypothetical protein